MIEIHVNPARVERVVFTTEAEPGSEAARLEREFDQAAWAVVRPHVEALDRALQEVVADVLGPPPPKLH